MMTRTLFSAAAPPSTACLLHFLTDLLIYLAFAILRPRYAGRAQQNRFPIMLLFASP